MVTQKYHSKKRGNNGAFWYETKKKTLMYLSETTLLATRWGVADCGCGSKEWQTTGEADVEQLRPTYSAKKKISWKKRWRKSNIREEHKGREREREGEGEGYALLPLVEQVKERRIQRLNQGLQ